VERSDFSSRFGRRDALSILAPQVFQVSGHPFDLAGVDVPRWFVASVTAVLFGLWPAWQSSRADVRWL